MTPQPPPGQGPIDPRGAFSPPPPPGAPQPMAGGFVPPPMGMNPGTHPGMHPGMMQPPMPPGFMPQMNFGSPGWFPPPRPPRGFGRTLLTTFATTIFGISIMLNIYLLLLTGILGDKGDRSTSSTIVEGDAKQVVAVVPIVNRMILQKDADELDMLLKQVEADQNVKALVLRIDTPGGEVAPSDEMYHRVMKFKERRPGVPVVVSMGGFATSGGYYVACGADWLVAEPQTWTANIGVLDESFNCSELLQRWGIKDTSLHSSGAEYKTTGSPFGPPPTTQEIDYLTSLLDAAAAQFKQVVITGRGNRINPSQYKEIFNAKAYSADQASKLGLVDQIGYQEDACKYAASKAGLSNMTVTRFEIPVPLLKQLLGAESKMNAPGAQSGLKINGMTVESPELDRFLNPRPMYLWRAR